MNTFGVKHDCPNVPYVNHHFMMYGVQSSAEDCADVRDMMFFVPDYRMMNHNYRGNSTSSEPTVTSRLSDYMNYHTDHQPTLGLYIIEQDEIGKAQVSGKDVYQLTLTWRTNLHKFLPSDDQVYYLYQVEVDDNGIEQYIPLYYMNADGKYTDENDQVLADQSKPQKIKLTVAASSADKTYSKIYVPMEQSSQVLTFAVQGQDATEFLDLKMSNTQDVVIPGLDPNELVTLTDATHYSRFNAQDVTNCYSNLIKLENNAMGLNNNNITSGTQLTLTRSYTEGTTNVEKEVATITFNPSNRQLTVTMANQSAKGLFPVGKTAVNGTKLPAGYHANKGDTTWTQTYRVDNSGLIWLDRQSNNSDYRLLIYDNFVVDVKNNDHPNSYTYKLTSNYTGSITTVYLNSAEAYDASGALWYAWTWSTANDGKWVKGVSTGESHQYKFVGVKKYMKIARMNPDALDPENPSWSAEWNETGDLTVGGDNADKNTFTFTGWLYGDWSGTNPETAYSNYFRIPVFKTDTDVNNKNDRDAVDDDESGATFESEAFTFKEKVQYSSKKQILRYDAYRWGVTEDRYILDKVRANDDEDDIAPNGIAANQDGEYTVSMNEVGTSVYSTSRVTVEQGDNDKWAVFTDYYPGSEASTEGGKPFGQAFVYAPVIETFTTGMQANSTTQAREDYNTYGGPLQSFAVGKFSLSQATPEQGGVNALMSDHYWEVNGKKYSYYNIRLNVDSKSIPEGYEIYKIRAWREVDPSVLKEEFPAFQGRVKARYMFEDRTFPDYDKGESYVLGSETRTDSVTQVNLVNNQPYTSPITYTLGTFGAERVRTANDSQDDQTLRQTPIEVGFFVRIYMTRTSNLADLNTTQSQGSKAEPELPADDKYYLVEAQTSVTIEPGSVVTGLVQNLNNSREVVGVKYYNMLGIESDRPFDGVNIVVTRYSDGSTTSTKILK